jgi:hypothetical protein
MYKSENVNTSNLHKVDVMRKPSHQTSALASKAKKTDIHTAKQGISDYKEQKRLNIGVGGKSL